jgi:hypothetical protein
VGDSVAHATFLRELMFGWARVTIDAPDPLLGVLRETPRLAELEPPEVNPNRTSVVTTFNHFTDPYRLSDVDPRFSPPFGSTTIDESYFEWNGALEGFDEADFNLLVRTIELVVQAGSFRRERLQHALRISPESAERMTSSLEKLGVIGPGKPDGARHVLVNVIGLPVLLAKVLSGRSYLPSALSAAS